jgi:hypothetical protein
MRLKVSAIALFAMFIGAQGAASDTFEIWHGWMNIQPCSEVEWTNSGAFGTPSPTVRTADQELHGRIFVEIDASDFADVQNDFLSCAENAAAAAGIAAILTSSSAAWPTFWAWFQSCLQTSAASAMSWEAYLETESQCNW